MNEASELLHRPGRRAVSRAGARRAGALALGVLLVGSGVLIGGRHRDSAPTSSLEAVGTRTAAITRGSISVVDRVSGALGYGSAAPVLAATSGTVTSLPPEGTVLRPGSVVYRIDDRPLVLLSGALPAWRTMSGGDTGRDVRQLQEGLHGLGLLSADDITGRFKISTTLAVNRWQRRLGLRPTGSVSAAEVIFRPAGIRVGTLQADVGSRVVAGVPLFGASTDEQQITVAVDTSEQQLVRPGLRVNVSMGGASSRPARVLAVGRVAHTTPTAVAGQADSSQTRSTVDVIVSVPPGSNARMYDQMPCSVEIPLQTHTDVLVAPVTALIARSGGGYAVEIAESGAGRRLAEVHVGLFDDDSVEISGAGVRAGQLVVVPS